MQSSAHATHPSRFKTTLLAIGTALLAGCTHLREREVTEVRLSPAAREAMRTLISQQPGERLVRNIAPTGSMAPTLDEHFIVIVEKRPFNDLKVGDITGEYYLGEIFAHRILYRRAHGMFATKGDALKYVDVPVLTPDTYNGEVVIAAIEKRTGEIRLMSDRPKQWHVADVRDDSRKAGSQSRGSPM